MAKILKILGRILGISFEWILLFITVFAFAIRTSTVQTYLAQKATEFLSKELNTTIRVGSVSIVFIDRVALDDVLVLDQQGDTLANIHTIYATLDELNLEKNFLKLDKAELEGGAIHIIRDKVTGDYNYWFITDYFDSGKKKKQSKPMDISLASLELSDIHFRYDDNRKGYSEYGMDFDHLDLKNIHLVAENFKTANGSFSADIKQLTTKEKCGFALDEFSTHVTITPKSWEFDNVRIKTPLSQIHAPKLDFLMNDMEDFQEFVDSVTFDARLAKSDVSLKDISYFAPNLKGMTDVVQLSGVVTKKVKDLKVSDLDLRIGKKTILRGTINLPDFRHFEKSFFSEKLDYAFVSLDDLKKIRMPDSSKDRYLSFDDYLERLGYFQAYDLRLDGFYSQFVVAADKVNTRIGSVKMDNGVMFTENIANNSFMFERSGASEYDVKIEKFQLGKFLDDSNFGIVDGIFFLTGEAFSLSDIHFTEIQGDMNQFDYMDYSYENIAIAEGSFIDQKFQAKIDINDDNLNLVYDGYIDFTKNQHMSFTVDIRKAFLDNLGITIQDSTSFKSSVTVNMFGKTANTLQGSITVNEMRYVEGDREIHIPSLTMIVARGQIEDHFSIDSPLATISLHGKIDFSTLIGDFTDQLKKVFPSVIPDKERKKKAKKNPSYFEYNIETHELNDFLAIFAPDLKIHPGTTLKGSYDGRKEDFSMKLLSNRITYGDFDFETVDLTQNLSSQDVKADYTVKKFYYGDSIKLDEVHFKTIGKNNILNSELTWNPGTTNESSIVWETSIVSNKHINFVLEPSYFSINKMRWQIEKQSDILLTDNEIHIAKFKLQRDKQYISIDGCISRNDMDKLNFKINDLNLQELGSLVGSDINMKGTVNGWGYISNPYTNLTYIGDLAIIGLYFNDQEVGDIYAQSQWNKASESVGMTGDLVYRGNETFKFEGSYFTARTEENLDFDLIFDQTDIRFTNAFMDPDVLNNIRGLINGRLDVSGTPDEPKIEGEVELSGGNAKMELLGVNFGFDGIISADEYGFYIDNMPVSDEEGNTGSLIGSVYHENYSNWNFDLQFNLEDDASGYATGKRFRPTPLDKFLVMNTQYKEGDYYFGKAYATGTANVFGYLDNLEITVDLQSKKGTYINFPMYGASEIDEEENFIQFISSGQSAVSEAPKIDFTGVELDMNFRVTPDAKLKIIFNEQIGDEISASGSGDIAMKLDNLGDLALDGTFRVKEGVYNFAMGPIKQNFYIQEGGTIAWTGDPYNATLDLKTYLVVKASLAEISPDQFQNTTNTSNQDVYCYLGLTESLLKPAIGFDIKAPKADESGKALISRITGDPDELSRQFFSLLLWKRFQPLKGTTAASGSAAADFASNQINSILDKVSKDYKMNVNLDADNVTGEKAMEFILSKGFLNDRLIVSGSFGVESNTSANQQNKSALIGDVSLEYLLNESGTVRINIFNESNDYSIIQDKNLGLFTQGAGLTYQEDFDNWDNFKLGQYFLDIFRSKENKRYPVKRKRKQTPVTPAEDQTILFILPDRKLSFS